MAKQKLTVKTYGNKELFHIIFTQNVEISIRSEGTQVLKIFNTFYKENVGYFFFILHGTRYQNVETVHTASSTHKAKTKGQSTLWKKTSPDAWKLCGGDKETRLKLFHNR